MYSKETSVFRSGARHKYIVLLNIGNVSNNKLLLSDVSSLLECSNNASYSVT